MPMDVVAIGLNSRAKTVEGDVDICHVIPAFRCQW